MLLCYYDHTGKQQPGLPLTCVRWMGTNVGGPNRKGRISLTAQENAQESLYRVVLGNGCSRIAVTFSSGTPPSHGGGLAFPEENPTLASWEDISKCVCDAGAYETRHPLGSTDKFFKETSPGRKVSKVHKVNE